MAKTFMSMFKALERMHGSGMATASTDFKTRLVDNLVDIYDMKVGRKGDTINEKRLTEDAVYIKFPRLGITAYTEGEKTEGTKSTNYRNRKLDFFFGKKELRGLDRFSTGRNTGNTDFMNYYFSPKGELDREKASWNNDFLEIVLPFFRPQITEYLFYKRKDIEQNRGKVKEALREKRSGGVRWQGQSGGSFPSIMLLSSYSFILELQSATDNLMYSLSDYIAGYKTLKILNDRTILRIVWGRDPPLREDLNNILHANKSVHSKEYDEMLKGEMRSLFDKDGKVEGTSHKESTLEQVQSLYQITTSYFGAKHSDWSNIVDAVNNQKDAKLTDEEKDLLTTFAQLEPEPEPGNLTESDFPEVPMSSTAEVRAGPGRAVQGTASTSAVQTQSPSSPPYSAIIDHGVSPTGRVVSVPSGAASSATPSSNTPSVGGRSIDSGERSAVHGTTSASGSVIGEMVPGLGVHTRSLPSQSFAAVAARQTPRRQHQVSRPESAAYIPSMRHVGGGSNRSRRDGQSQSSRGQMTKERSRN